MPFDAHTVREARVLHGIRKNAHSEEFIRKRDAIFEKVPRLAELSVELSGTVLDVIQGILTPEGVSENRMKLISQKNEQIAVERTRLLAENGYEADALTEKYVCDKCADEGYLADGLCDCLKSLCISVCLDEFARECGCSYEFTDFNESVFSDDINPKKGISPRCSMRFNKKLCEEFSLGVPYAENTLVMSGDPGTGKTFLASCISRNVIRRGYAAVYASAPVLFEKYENRRFHGSDDSDAIERYERCDLLVIDDLGAEMTTAYSSSCFYTLLNQRINSLRPTIICTTLHENELMKKYGKASCSRLFGRCVRLDFFGEDLRNKLNDRGV